jgi:hypothetical protein
VVSRSGEEEVNPAILWELLEALINLEDTEKKGLIPGDVSTPGSVYKCLGSFQTDLTSFKLFFRFYVGVRHPTELHTDIMLDLIRSPSRGVLA